MKNEDWKECSFKDLYLIPSKNGVSKPSRIRGSGYKMINMGELFSNDRIYDIPMELVPLTELEKQSSKVEKGDLLFARQSLVAEGAGKCSIVMDVSPLTVFESHLIRVRLNPLKADSLFFYYYFKSPKSPIKRIIQHCVQAGIKASDLAELIVKIPSLAKQKEIAKILSALDDKIELNNAINRNLEEQAQVIFKNWFVDFEPFGGVKPKNWIQSDIYNIARIIYGAPFSSKLFNTEKNGKPIYRIRDLKEQVSEVYTSEEIDDAYLIQPKDIVVGMDGEFRPYIWGGEPGWLNQRVCVFENKRPKGKAFLYFSIKPLLDQVEKTQVATTVIHIGKKDFDRFEITLPSNEVLDSFDKLTNPIIDEIVANRQENQRLTTLRNALLPKLMSGEINVA